MLLRRSGRSSQRSLQPTFLAQLSRVQQGLLLRNEVVNDADLIATPISEVKVYVADVRFRGPLRATKAPLTTVKRVRARVL